MKIYIANGRTPQIINEISDQKKFGRPEAA